MSTMQRATAAAAERTGALMLHLDSTAPETSSDSTTVEGHVVEPDCGCGKPMMPSIDYGRRELEQWGDRGGRAS